VPRSIKRLFKLSAKDQTYNHAVKLSCFQVYCERAFDLLKSEAVPHLFGTDPQNMEKLRADTGLRMRMNPQVLLHVDGLWVATVVVLGHR
jgi:hypothetical protein